MIHSFIFYCNKEIKFKKNILVLKILIFFRLKKKYNGRNWEFERGRRNLKKGLFVITTNL